MTDQNPAGSYGYPVTYHGPEEALPAELVELGGWTAPADGMDGRWESYPALAAEPIRSHPDAEAVERRYNWADDSAPQTSAVVPMPMPARSWAEASSAMTPAKRDLFRAVIERVDAANKREHRKEIMGDLARARRKRGSR